MLIRRLLTLLTFLSALLVGILSGVFTAIVVVPTPPLAPMKTMVDASGFRPGCADRRVDVRRTASSKGAGSIGQVLGQRADLAKRFVLRGANDRRQQSLFNCNCDAEIDVRVLQDCVVVE